MEREGRRECKIGKYEKKKKAKCGWRGRGDNNCENGKTMSIKRMKEDESLFKVKETSIH